MILALVFSTVLHGQSAEDATAIANRFIEGVTKAWEARDGRAYAAAFWPDAEIVNVFGGVMAGEQVIAARMDQILKGALNARDSKQTIRKVRMLRPMSSSSTRSIPMRALQRGPRPCSGTSWRSGRTHGAPWPGRTPA